MKYRVHVYVECAWLVPHTMHICYEDGEEVYCELISHNDIVWC